MKINANVLMLAGKIVSIKQAYAYENENFYETMIEVDRRSDTKDILPVIMSGKLMFRNDVQVGNYITLEGELRMANHTENGCRNIYTFGYVKDFAIIQEDDLQYISERNCVSLEGFVCKEPRYRQTTLSNRYITDLLIANNRPNNKSFYIPCIAWGITAKMASKFHVGDKVLLEGRFQSRRYKKDPLNGKPNDYSVQEVSITDIMLAEENTTENQANKEIA